MQLTKIQKANLGWLIWYLGDRKVSDGNPILSEWEENLLEEVILSNLESPNLSMNF